MSESILKYRTYATNINETIPIGNGTVGGMIYGKPAEELISLNLDSFWSGRHFEINSTNFCNSIREVRNLTNNGDIVSAEKKAVEIMKEMPSDMQWYIPFLELHINCIFDGKAKNYARCLNLENSVSSVCFDAGNKHFQRDYICTGDEGIVIEFSCDEDESISFDTWLDGKMELFNYISTDIDNTVMYTGGLDNIGEINFAAFIAIKADGGETEISGNRISVRNADSVMLIFNAGSDADTEDIGETVEMIMEHIEDAMGMSFNKITENHISWYQSIYNRIELFLEDDSKENLDTMATDERLLRLKGDKLDSKECTRLINDNKLIELYFNFGRYLMITLGTATYPMNLCGLWNDSDDSHYRYLLAGSLQMCYWAADVCGIKECMYPLFDFIKRIEKTGRKTANKMYDIDDGSVCHTATDLWGDSSPQGTSPDSLWCMCLAWLVIHFFEHYEYIMDRDFLEDKYLIMRSAAMFFVKYLTEDEKGRLIVSPSVSPTSAYIAENGSEVHLCKGASVDSQILRVLFNDIIKSCDIIGFDNEFAELLESLATRLPEIETGKYGQIKEWYDDFEEAESADKLLYHLFALYPSDLITPIKTPKLADAARTTLIRRLIQGGLDKGFGCAWTANMWARLYDGNMVYENIKNLLICSTAPNLINTYPDFRIDANMGAVAAIAESLLQCTSGEIVLLPALPQEWGNGYVRGLRAKGGFEISMEWADGKLTGAEIKSNAGEECRLRLIKNITVSIISDDEYINPRIENGAVVFNTTAGIIYTIRC